MQVTTMGIRPPIYTKTATQNAANQLPYCSERLRPTQSRRTRLTALLPQTDAAAIALKNSVAGWNARQYVCDTIGEAPGGLLHIEDCISARTNLPANC